MHTLNLSPILAASKAMTRVLVQHAAANLRKLEYRADFGATRVVPHLRNSSMRAFRKCQAVDQADVVDISAGRRLFI